MCVYYIRLCYRITIIGVPCGEQTLENWIYKIDSCTLINVGSASGCPKPMHVFKI